MTVMGSTACLLSAVSFGVMALFAKLAYADGVGVTDLLLLRFGLAAAMLLCVTLVTGRFRALDAREVVAGLLMGAVGYAAQAGLYFAALTRVDAAQVALIFCLYPLLVMVIAAATGRDRIGRARMLALVAALTGVALVLGGSSPASLDLVGAVCAMGSALVYTAYILVGDRVAAADPLTFATLVCTGAFGSFAIWSGFRGALDLAAALAAWPWVVLIALVSTVGAVLLFFAGLARVGPTTASLLSVVEPVVTVTGAAVVFGEEMSVTQTLGGVLVVATLVLTQLPARSEQRAAGQLVPN